MKSIVKVMLAVFLLLPTAALAMGASTGPDGPDIKAKPASPLSGVIEEGDSPETGLSGAAVPLMVAVSSSFDAHVVVRVKLTGGLRLASGEPEWTVSLKRGEVSSSTIVVEPSGKVGGKVTVIATYKGGKGSASFNAHASYRIGDEDTSDASQEKASSSGVQRHDGIVEYPAR